MLTQYWTIQPRNSISHLAMLNHGCLDIHRRTGRGKPSTCSGTQLGRMFQRLAILAPCVKGCKLFDSSSGAAKQGLGEQKHFQAHLATKNHQGQNPILRKRFLYNHFKTLCADIHFFLVENYFYSQGIHLLASPTYAQPPSKRRLHQAHQTSATLPA